MENQIQSVSSYLFRSEQLQVQCSLLLFDKHDETTIPVNLYTINKKQYLSIEPKCVLRFKYAPKIGSTEYIINNNSADYKYNPSFTAAIGPKEICGLQIMMENFWEAFNRDDLYVYNDDGYPVDMRATNDNIVVIQTMYKGVIQISPGIIYPPIDADGTQTSYPGVVISINKKSQSATITVDEFLYIKRIVEHFDFIRMGHQLLSEYLLLKKETVVERIGEGRKITSKEVANHALSAFMPQQKEMVSQKPFLQQTSKPTLDNLE